MMGMEVTRLTQVFTATDHLAQVPTPPVQIRDIQQSLLQAGMIGMGAILEPLPEREVIQTGNLLAIAIVIAFISNLSK